MPLQLIINGLSSDRYLFNNPIWVDVSNVGASAKYLNVMVTRNDNNKSVASRMYIYNSTIAFDVSEHVKGLCDYPHFPEGVLLDGQEINTNYYEFTILFQSYSGTGNLVAAATKVKTFIRGGIETQETNISIPDNTILKESVKVPIWNGYDFKIFRVVNNKIVAEDTLPTTQLENMPLVGCNPLYFRFMNMLGGYSYWLFENWEVTKKSEKTQIINRREQDISTGHKTTYNLSVESRVDRRFFKLIRALIQSPDVHVLGLSAKIDLISELQHPTEKWEQVWNRANTFPINAMQKLQNVKLNFDYKLKLNTQTTW